MRVTYGLDSYDGFHRPLVRVFTVVAVQYRGANWFFAISCN